MDIASHLDHLQFGKRTLEPVDHLAAYKAWLLMKCQTIWPKHDDLHDQVSIMADVQHLRKFASVPLDFFSGSSLVECPTIGYLFGCSPPSNCTVLHDEGEKLVCHVTDGHASFEVSVGKHTTAADLAAAEGQLQGWPQVCIRNCDADASPIQPDDVIQGHSLMVCQVDSDQGYGLPSNDWCLIQTPKSNQPGSPVHMEVEQIPDIPCPAPPGEPSAITAVPEEAAAPVAPTEMPDSESSDMPVADGPADATLEVPDHNPMLPGGDDKVFNPYLTHTLRGMSRV